jgi:hypothetical protein
MNKRGGKIMKFQITNSKTQLNSNHRNSQKNGRIWNWNIGFWKLIGFWCLVLGFLSGCATMKECAKGLAGVSTKILEDQRSNAIKKQYSLKYSDCYAKSRKALLAAGAYIYSEDTRKRLIAAYLSETDTTPVGVFFEQADADNTRVEVSSPSIYAKELIAEKLDKALSPAKEEEKVEKIH